MRKFLIGLVALVVLAVGAALVVPSFVDWNSYKGEITARALEATGRKLTIAGDLDLTVLPAPRLSVRDVRFANIAGGSVPDMVRLKSLDVRVRFWPLLRGKIEVDSITLVEPSILLERLADGRANWDITPPGTTAEEAGDRPGAGGGAPPIRLDRLRIERGTLVWRDAASGAEEKITGISVDLAAESLRGPFRIKGKLVARGIPLDLDATLGALKPEAASAVSLSLALPSAAARADISGSLALLAEAPRFTGKLDTKGEDLGRVLAALSGAAGPPMLAQPFRLRAALSGSSKAASVDNLDIEFGTTHASGKATVTLGPRPRADVKLRVTRINLDAMPSGKPAGKPAEKATAAAPATPATPAATPKPFALPAGIDVALDLGIDVITYNRQSMRNVRVEARLASGQLVLERAALQLPGGGDATLTGRLAAVDGRPTFEGKLNTQVDDFRGLLGWLGIDVGAVPADRLRKFALSTSLLGNDQQIQLRDGRLSLDTTRADFAITMVLRKRPAFGATLNIGDINLDAYLPRGGPAKPTAKAKPAAKPGFAPLAALNDIDANLVLRVGTLTYNRTPVRDIRFNGTLSNGKLTIRKASVGNVGGARAALAGTLGNFSGFPVFKGTVSADAKDIGGLLRLAGIKPPPAARSLGALRLRGKADANADRVTVDLALDAAGAKTTVKGTLAGLRAQPSFTGTVTARHPDLALLIRTLGGDPGSVKLGGFGVTLNAKGDLKALAIDLKGFAAGVKLTAVGAVDGILGAPVFKLDVTASHASTTQLARLFLPKYRPAGGKLGPFSLSATLNGSQAVYNLASFKVSAGKVALDGAGKLTTGGARPALTATLRAGAIDLNPFWQRKSGAKAGAAKPGAPAGAGRFSSDAIDTTALGLIDADLSISADALIWRKFKVDKPTIRMTLADRLLTLTEVSGRMFDGAFKLNGRLNGRAVPALDGTVTIAKANVGKALFQTGTFDITGGITDFSMNLATRGASPRAMVAALDGGGRIASTNGVVKGFDLTAVSNRLKNLDGALDFLSLFGSAMGGGQTRFSRLDGTFAIKRGVLTTNDMTLRAEAGEGTARGFANLPRWKMDFTSQFRLTQHPKAPPFGMRVVGPIDNPRRVFKFQELQTYLLQRGVGSLLRRVFPGARRTAPAPTQQQQKPRRPRLEDLIPGLLKGLGG